MSSIIEFDPRFLVGMDATEGEISVERAFSDYTKGPTFAVEADGEVALCGGIRMLWEGCGEAWFTLSKKHAWRPSVLRLARQWLVDAIKKYDIIRVQSLVATGWREGERSVLFFGFNLEGILRKYAPDGSDMSIYSRIL